MRILPRRLFGQTLSFNHLLPQITKAQLKSPSGQNIVRKNRFIQRLKEMVMQKLALLLADLRGSEPLLHPLNHARFDGLPLLDRTDLQPLHEVLMKARIAQQR